MEDSLSIFVLWFQPSVSWLYLLIESLGYLLVFCIDVRDNRLWQSHQAQAAISAVVSKRYQAYGWYPYLHR